LYFGDLLRKIKNALSHLRVVNSCREFFAFRRISSKLQSLLVKLLFYRTTKSCQAIEREYFGELQIVERHPYLEFELFRPIVRLLKNALVWMKDEQKKISLTGVYLA